MIFIQWWMARVRREKMMLMAALTILLGIIVYLAIEPVLLEREHLQETIPKLQSDLGWMQSQLEVVQGLRGQVEKQVNEDLTLSDVEDLVISIGIEQQLSELKPGSSGELKARFEDVSYAKLLDLLYLLRQQKHASATQLSITLKTGKTGLVDASVSVSVN